MDSFILDNRKFNNYNDYNFLKGIFAVGYYQEYKILSMKGYSLK